MLLDPKDVTDFIDDCRFNDCTHLSEPGCAVLAAIELGRVCCGFAVDYQAFNYPDLSALFPVPADRRINLSFTLAGLGTFQNMFGAFGGTR